MLPNRETRILNAFQGIGSARVHQLRERSGLGQPEVAAAVLRLERTGWVVCSERRLTDATFVFLLRPWTPSAGDAGPREWSEAG